MPVLTKDQVIEVLRPIHDPEIRIGIVDLGLVYDVIVHATGKVDIKMTLTTPACPYGEILINEVHKEVAAVDGVSGVEVILVWDPIWDPETMASDSAKDILGIW